MGAYGTGAYVVRGPLTADLDLSLALGLLTGESGDDLSGYSVSHAGDADADGSDDVLVGAPHGGEEWNGAAYLVLGPVSGELSLSTADLRLYGEHIYDEAGISVSGAGDVDSDGFVDLLGFVSADFTRSAF